MGAAPLPGEDQEVTVDITGPEPSAGDAEKAEFAKSFEEWKADIARLRQKYGKLKIRVSKISYTKKDPAGSF